MCGSVTSPGGDGIPNTKMKPLAAGTLMYAAADPQQRLTGCFAPVCVTQVALGHHCGTGPCWHKPQGLALDTADMACPMSQSRTAVPATASGQKPWSLRVIADEAHLVLEARLVSVAWSFAPARIAWDR